MKKAQLDQYIDRETGNMRTVVTFRNYGKYARTYVNPSHSSLYRLAQLGYSKRYNVTALPGTRYSSVFFTKQE